MMRPAMGGMVAVCLALAAVLAAELYPSPNGGETRTSRAGAAPALPKPGVTLDEPSAEWIETALARPLLSPTRRPAAVVPVAAREASGVPRLSGILIGPGGRRAIFVNTQGGKPLVVEEGGTVQAYRVDRIDAGEVAVSGPDGMRRLRPSFADRAVVPLAAAPEASDLPPGILPMDAAPVRAAPGGARR